MCKAWDEYSYYPSVEICVKKKKIERLESKSSVADCSGKKINHWSNQMDTIWVAYLPSSHPLLPVEKVISTFN
jgi:hypothetical protein